MRAAVPEQTAAGSANAAARRAARTAAQFRDRPLSAADSGHTCDELLSWLKSGSSGAESGTSFAPERYWEGSGCVAYLGQWVGTPHVDQYGFACWFPDGTSAFLPLPFNSPAAPAPPASVSFDGDTLTYTVVFDKDLDSYLHFAGTCVYTVDLSGRTVSLTIQ